MSAGNVNRRALRERVAGEQNWLCCYCGGEMLEEQGRRDSVTLERVIPGSMGGRYEYGNVAAACWGCNNDRGDGTRKAVNPGTPRPHGWRKARERSEQAPWTRWPPEARVTLADVWPKETRRS